MTPQIFPAKILPLYDRMRKEQYIQTGNHMNWYTISGRKNDFYNAGANFHLYSWGGTMEPIRIY
jgi:hypothetical protein